MHRRSLLILPLLLVAASSAGCVVEPTMQVYAARVAQVAPTGVTLQLTMKVRNDNAFDVMVRGVRATVLLADRFVLPHIVVTPNQWIAADGETFMQVPVVIPWELVVPILQATLGSEQIAYRAQGAADVTATRALGIAVDGYELDQTGTMSRADLLAAAGRGAAG